MTVCHADFITVTLGRIRWRRHIAIKHLLYSMCQVHGRKSTFLIGRSTPYALQYELQIGRIRRCVNFRRPLLANFVLSSVIRAHCMAAHYRIFWSWVGGLRDLDFWQLAFCTQLPRGLSALMTPLDAFQTGQGWILQCPWAQVKHSSRFILGVHGGDRVVVVNKGVFTN